jgi:hypothetical protein
MIKGILAKITGLDKLKAELIAELNESKQLSDAAKSEAELALAELEKAKTKASEALKEAADAEELAKHAKTDEKDKATARHQPWVSVLDTNLNAENPRNGFFELDWNSYFIAQLIEHGYGYEDDPEEEIVDRWFRDLATNILQEHDMPTKVPAGYINFRSITKEHTEVQ